MAAAYFNSNPDVIKTLLEAGADPLLKSNKGATALDYLRCNKKMKNSKAYNLLLYQTLSPKNRKSKS
jgi:ankyrin repeat protein